MLFPKIFSLFSGSDPVIKSVLKHAQTPGSGFLYLLNKSSLQDEIITLQKVLSQESGEQLSRLIRQHLDTIAKNTPFLQALEIIDQYCYKLPVPVPPPPPPPFIPTSLKLVRFISFFTRSELNKVELHKNGQLFSVLKESSFNDLTKIRTVRVPCRLQFNSGDNIVLKLPVGYLDSAGKIQNIMIDYKPII
jgi:hypothetical protein